MLGLRHQPAKEAALSLTELTNSRDVLARALSSAGVNQLGRETGQAQRLRTVTPHRLFLAIVSALGVAHKAFDNRLARTGFEAFMRRMCTRLIAQLRTDTLTPEGETAR